MGGKRCCIFTLFWCVIKLSERVCFCGYAFLTIRTPPCLLKPRGLGQSPNNCSITIDCQNNVTWCPNNQILFLILKWEPTLGDLLHYLATEHDTLRIPNKDKNQSRWPLHLLWENLINEIGKLNNTGIYRTYNEQASFDLQQHRIATAILGYLKRAAAIQSIQNNLECIDYKSALKNIQPYLNRVHCPHTWQNEVEQRKKEIELGKW